MLTNGYLRRSMPLLATISALGACAGGSGPGGTVPIISPSALTGSPSTGVPATTSSQTPDAATIPGSFATSTTFPLHSSSLLFGQDGVAAPFNEQTATITTSTSAHPYTYQLSVPSVGLNASWWESVDPVASLGDGVPWGFNYVAMGEWDQRAQMPSNTGALQSVTQFVFGYETPASSMPSTGQAKFSGWVQGNTFPQSGGLPGWLDGQATFSADFTSGQLSGSFTNMQARAAYCTCESSASAWNDVSVNASIAAATNKISGTTAISSAPQTQFSLKPSATGTINGGFYGPTAQQLGAIWSLSDGTTSAIGAVIAAH